MATLNLIVNSITPSKNPAIFMANTAKGAFIVRKAQLEKRGISVGVEGFRFPDTTVAVIKTHAAGDYVYGLNETTGKPNPAPQDSSRLDDKGKPVYLKGAFPKWDSEGAAVVSFVGFNEFKAQMELEKLMTQ